MRITESRLRRIIRSVIRETKKDIFRRISSDHEEDSDYEEENIVDYTDEENFPSGSLPGGYDDDKEEASGPFGMTSKEREKLYKSRDFPEDFQPQKGEQPVLIPSRRKVSPARSKGPISKKQKDMMKR